MGDGFGRLVTPPVANLVDDAVAGHDGPSTGAVDCFSPARRDPPIASSPPLLEGKHGGCFTLEVDERLTTDVDGDLFKVPPVNAHGAVPG